MIQLSSHVKHPHEHLDMSVFDYKQLIFDVLFSGVHVTEKLDGQNFTFFVDDLGSVRFVGKGVIKWIRSQGGFNRNDIQKHYESKPDILNSFLHAYDALQQLVDKNSTIFKNACKNDNYISCEVLCASSRNVVLYENNFVCMLGLTDNNVDVLSSLNELLPFNAKNKWTIDKVPVLDFNRKHDALDKINKLHLMLDDLVTKFSLKQTSSIEDVGTALIRYSLKGLVPSENLHSAALRLLTQDKSHLKRSDFKHPVQWKQFQEIEDHRSANIQEFLYPLIEISVKLGVIANEFYIPKQASLDDKNTLRTISHVKTIIDAFNAGCVVGDHVIMKRLKTDIMLVGKMYESFKNIEGIVFNYNDKTIKLVGLYTIINRICGYFKFGVTPLQIIKRSK